MDQQYQINNTDLFKQESPAAKDTSVPGWWIRLNAHAMTAMESITKYTTGTLFYKTGYLNNHQGSYHSF